MLPAIQLNGEPQSRTIEIQNEVAGGMPSAEARAVDLRASQFLPKAALGSGRIDAKLAGAVGLDRGAIEAGPGDPHPDPPLSGGGSAPSVPFDPGLAVTINCPSPPSRSSARRRRGPRPR